MDQSDEERRKSTIGLYGSPLYRTITLPNTKIYPSQKNITKSTSASQSSLTKKIWKAVTNPFYSGHSKSSSLASTSATLVPSTSSLPELISLQDTETNTFIQKPSSTSSHVKSAPSPAATPSTSSPFLKWVWCFPSLLKSKTLSEPKKHKSKSFNKVTAIRKFFKSQPESKNVISERDDRCSKKLLPPLHPSKKDLKCLVLDLDETLIHSSFKPIGKADFSLTVTLDYFQHHIYVQKRPGVDEFLRKLSEYYELVIFTASQKEYSDPVITKLDISKVISYRLFRQDCSLIQGHYIKDLSMLGRDLSKTIIIDNSPVSYMLNKSNAIPISSWLGDESDRELKDLLPVLIDLSLVDDVRTVLVC